MKRRKFIQLSGMGMAAAPFAGNLVSAKTSPPVGFQSPEVIVVGAGTFGAWTAYHLSKMGAKVTLLDAFGPGNSRASSGGETRLIQTNNDNDSYVKTAMRSFDLWKQVEDESGVQLVLQTGALYMSPEESYHSKALERKKQHVALGINNTEILDQDEVKYRWPQINAAHVAVAMYHDGGASGSTLFARRGCDTVARQMERNGGKIQIAKGTPVIEDGKVAGVDVGGDRPLMAAHYVFACGPWLSKLFPDLLLPKLKVQRRDVLFVGTPAGDDTFSYPNLPQWSFAGSGYYGFPDIEGRGLKVAPYPDYNAIDPDTDERLVDQYQVKRTHDFAKKYFPGLADQPITESRVCQVTYSVDGNFIVDQHPTSENTWIIGAGSGHGFKHGPAIGEYAAKRILGASDDPVLNQLFQLKEGTF